MTKWTVKTIDAELSTKQELLLLKGLLNDGQLTFEMAKRYYSSKDSAQSAIATLEFEDCIKSIGPGVFRVIGVTKKVVDKYDKKIGNSERSEQDKD